MTGWLVYRKKDAERNVHNIGFYERACHKRGAEIYLFYLELFSFGTDGEIEYDRKAILKWPDFVVMRADDPTFSKSLEARGVRVFNRSSFAEIANDKEKTLQVAKQAGIPIPETRVADQTNALAMAEAISYPLVMKPKDGHGGQGVLWVENQDALLTLLCDYPHESFLLQRPVSLLGRDLRVYVLGDEIIAAMLREQDNDFRSNYCLGGSARNYPLSSEEEALVRRTMALFDYDFAGIDFMFHNGQMVLNEIEDVVGARMLYHLTEIDVVDLYVAYILKHI